METLTLINGNKQPMRKFLPTLFIQEDYINDTALAHILENTGLLFRREGWGYEAHPTSSSQIAALFLTYNYKTRYYDNADIKNTLILKNDHHVGFDVNSICFKCAKHNNIHTGDLEADDRLAC